MIHRSGTFEYQAEFTAEGFSSSDIVLHGTDRRGGNKDCLLGSNPKIRFWNERLVLIASEQSKANVRNVSFPIGDAVCTTARAGDRLYLTRTGAGGIGMSLLRQQKLILATGAITAVPLGPDIQASISSGNAHDWEDAAAEARIEFRAGSEQLSLREREVAKIGDYHIYIERCWEHGMPGTDECVSLSVTDDSALQIAAIRAAILLGNGAMKMTRWDCAEVFAEL